MTALWQDWEFDWQSEADIAIEHALDTVWGQAAWRALHDGRRGSEPDWFSEPKRDKWVTDGNPERFTGVPRRFTAKGGL